MHARIVSARVVLAVALSIAATGCVFLVDSLPDGTTSSCNLLSDASVCAGCISTNCKTQLDACCGDDSCRGLLSDADECAKYEECSDLGKASATGKGADFVSCIRTSCGASCSGIGERGTGTDASTCSGCTTACATGESNACSCVPASSTQPSNAVVCPTYQLDNPICCATPGFPSSGQCNCVSIFCSQSNGVCQCAVGSFVDGETNQSSCTPIQTEDICCLDATNGYCTCGAELECSSDETQVDECSSATMVCPTSGALTKRTTRCSTFTD